MNTKPPASAAAGLDASKPAMPNRNAIPASVGIKNLLGLGLMAQILRSEVLACRTRAVNLAFLVFRLARRITLERQIVNPLPQQPCRCGLEEESQQERPHSATSESYTGRAPFTRYAFGRRTGLEPGARQVNGPEAQMKEQLAE